MENICIIHIYAQSFLYNFSISSQFLSVFAINNPIQDMLKLVRYKVSRGTIRMPIDDYSMKRKYNSNDNFYEDVPFIHRI